MGRIIRHEFLGSRLFVVAACCTIIGIPIALIYIIQCTVTIVEEMESPTEFLQQWKSERSISELFREIRLNTHS